MKNSSFLSFYSRVSTTHISLKCGVVRREGVVVEWERDCGDPINLVLHGSQKGSAQMPSATLRRMHVYFVVGGGKTKVGVAADPEVRLGQLQTCSPVELRLTHIHRDGGWKVERTIHQVLTQEGRHSHAEWFHGEIERDEARKLCKGKPGRAAPTPRQTRFELVNGTYQLIKR